MSYQGPIAVIMGQMKISYENEILKAVQSVGVNVDKNELLKALRYDREQYQKGYADRDSEIIRCGGCEHCYYADNRPPDERCYACGKHGIDVAPDWFCADGKRCEGH